MNNEVELAVAIIVTLDWAKDCITIGRREYNKRVEKGVSFNTYIHTFIHTYIHTYIHACIHAYIQ